MSGAPARAEKIADRVEPVTDDMRRLPFEDGTFDLVVSSPAVHNIPNAKGRTAAIREAFRVVRPGGRLRPRTSGTPAITPPCCASAGPDPRPALGSVSGRRRPA
ncbi:class I SAM-dependent methyltransferase [Microtetraspora malaysiensis]|uniref:class I SAM-dependent methyltransferase n=1 Tax=Microtetraspora malaysiensis TaxID=161358 RepID=UPI003D92A8EF